MSIFDGFKSVYFLGGGVMAERIYCQHPCLKDKFSGAIDLLNDDERIIKKIYE